MKKKLALLLVLVLAAGILAGCGKKAEEEKVITVGASITPHAEILKVAGEILAEQGITLKVSEFSDYVQPNNAVESGELMANYFQHQEYLDQFNIDYNTHLVSVAAIHYEPFGIYPGRTKTIEELADGAIIAVPNDGTNEARALMLLEAQGLIKLKADAGTTATVLDIAENPKNLDIREMEAAQIALSLPDVDLAVINGNYALQAGLNAGRDALVVEDKSSAGGTTYANVLCVKEGNENNELVKALVEALQSDKVREYMETTYEGAVVPVF